MNEIRFSYFYRSRSLALLLFFIRIKKLRRAYVMVFFYRRDSSGVRNPIFYLEIRRCHQKAIIMRRCGLSRNLTGATTNDEKW